MTSKSKKDKIKQGNQKDFDLLYDVLVSGGTYSDYRSELLDRSMPQEQQNFDISEDDILAAWILGKDEESELYARGGHIHQDQPWMLNPNNKGIGLLQKDLNQNSFTSGVSKSDYTPTGLYSSDSGHNYTAGIPYVQQFDSLGGLGFNVAANANGASDDPYAKFIMGDTSGGFLQQMLSLKSSLREGANYIKSLELNFGVGDNAYLAQQYNQMQPIARSTMDADAVDTWKWIFDPSGIMHSWGLIDYDASEGLDYLNSIAEQVENRNKQNFNTAVTNSNKLNLWNQLSQPYMAACGGKMKNRLASGGYINSHYDYITDPLVKVNAGGTHQENPNEGVLTSIAPDGQPNLVEEGETIINNQDDAYVFSDRIVADDEILKSHLLPNKFAGKTYADISKELDKIIEEHKNDEISKRTFDEMISRLQQALEDQKFQEKQEEVEKFLDGLTDEQKEQLEQTMVEEAQAEQQAAEEQAVAELQAQELAAAEQGIPEQAPEQAPEQVVTEQPEELIVPSRYDQMMSRALFADAANQGMFGLGGHLHQDYYSDATSMYRDPITPEIRRYAIEERQRNINSTHSQGLPYYEEVNESPISEFFTGRKLRKINLDGSEGIISNAYIGQNGNPVFLSTGIAPVPSTKTGMIDYFNKEKEIEKAWRAAQGVKDVVDKTSKTSKAAKTVNTVAKASKNSLKIDKTADVIKAAEEAEKSTKLGKAGKWIAGLGAVGTIGAIGTLLNNNDELIYQQPEPVLTDSIHNTENDFVSYYDSLYRANKERNKSNPNIFQPGGYADVFYKPRWYYNSVGLPFEWNLDSTVASPARPQRDLNLSPTNLTGYYLKRFNEDNAVGNNSTTNLTTINTGHGYTRRNNSVLNSLTTQEDNTTEQSQIETIPNNLRYPISLDLFGSPVWLEDFFLRYNPNLTKYNFGDYRLTPPIVNDGKGNLFVIDRNGVRDASKLGFDYTSKSSENSNNASNQENSSTDYSTWLRYSPVIGSGIQYLSDLFGVTNRNDFSNADMFQKRINDIPNIGFTPLGNYMTYSPLDETYQQNVARSQYNAARRAIQNNASGNAGAALAAMDSLNGNMNNTFGDLALQSRQYNDAQRKAVEEFNANIARINSMMSLSAQEKNQAIAAEKAKLTYQLANMRENIQNMNDAAKSQNETMFYNNLGAIGKENFNMQMVRTNPAFYYTIMDDGSIVYKNGFYDLNKGDLDLITADAEKAQKEQLKKNSEDALKKSEDVSNMMSSPLIGRYFSRPGFWNGYQYTGGLTNNRR